MSSVSSSSTSKMRFGVLATTPVTGVYIIRNETSSRTYVGSSIDVAKRLFSHLSLLRRGKHHSPTLQRSWDKHGESAFIFQMVETVLDPRILLEREQAWIDSERSADPEHGLNILPVAGRRQGWKPTDEARQRMSLAAKGKSKGPWSIDRRASHVPHNKGAKANDEARIAMSLARKGVMRPPHSDETRAKISAAHKGKPPNIEALEKAHAASRGRKQSTEERRRRSEIHQARFQNPDAREARRAAAKLGWQRNKEKNSCA